MRFIGLGAEQSGGDKGKFAVEKFNRRKFRPVKDSLREIVRDWRTFLQETACRSECRQAHRGCYRLTTGIRRKTKPGTVSRSRIVTVSNARTKLCAELDLNY